MPIRANENNEGRWWIAQQIIESITSVIIKNSGRRPSLSHLTHCITKPRVWVRNMNHRWFSIQLFTIELITMGWIRSGCHQLTAWFSAYLSFLFGFGYFIIPAYMVESLLLPFLFFLLHSSLVLHSFSLQFSSYSFLAGAVKWKSCILFLEGPQCIFKFSQRSSLRSIEPFRWS